MLSIVAARSANGENLVLYFLPSFDGCLAMTGGPVFRGTRWRSGAMIPLQTQGNSYCRLIGRRKHQRSSDVVELVELAQVVFMSFVSLCPP